MLVRQGDDTKGAPVLLPKRKRKDILDSPQLAPDRCLSHNLLGVDLTSYTGKVGQPAIGRPKQDIDLVLVEITVDPIFAGILLPFSDPVQGLALRPGFGLERVE